MQNALIILGFLIEAKRVRSCSQMQIHASLEKLSPSGVSDRFIAGFKTLRLNYQCQESAIKAPAATEQS
jgi:hypothetical protein